MIVLRYVGFILLAACLATPTWAQTQSGQGAQLRGLDKVSGKSTDFALNAGESAEFGKLLISLSECRYPADNPAGDAYALLSIRDTKSNDQVFEGWMIASSPALSALEHRRYDVWALRCITE